MINRTKVKIVSVTIAIVILLFFAMVSDCNAQHNYGVTDKDRVKIYDTSSITYGTQFSKYGISEPLPKGYTVKFYLIALSTDSSWMSLEMDKKEMEKVIYLLHDLLKRNGIKSQITKRKQ